MLRRSSTLLALLTATAALTAVAPASASTSPPVADCNAHGRLTQHYSVAQLRSALATMPADVEAYTNCYTVIHDALLGEIPAAQHPAATTTTSSSGSFLPTPVIVVIVIIVVGGAAVGGFALSRRRSQNP